jgi:hypothetical protein
LKKKKESRERQEEFVFCFHSSGLQNQENSRFQMVGKAGTSLIPKEQLTTFNRCYLATETYFFFIYIFLYVYSFPGL